MPRSLSTALQTQVSADATKIAFLVELNLSTPYDTSTVTEGNSFTISGTSVSLGASSSIGVLVSWQAVTVADGSTTLTAEAGKGYFLDTNTGVIEVFLPSSPNRGDVIILVDYSGTFATNQAIINTGGQLIDSTAGPDFKLTTNFGADVKRVLG